MDQYDDLYAKIGTLVREHRDRANLTQEHLAQMTNLTRTSITNIEAGRQRIQIHTLFAVAKALDVSPTSLLPVENTNKSVDEILPDEDEETRRWFLRVTENKSDEKEKTTPNS